MGGDGDSVLPLVMSHQYAKAVSTGLRLLRGFVRDPLELTAEARGVLRYVYVVCVSLFLSLRVCSFLFLTPSTHSLTHSQLQGAQVRQSFRTG